MAGVSIRGLIKNFDGTPPTAAVDDLDLEIEDGEFLVLLGPSGCGKSTTLRCIGGLETPAAGTIDVGGRTLFDHGSRVDIPSNKRNIGMVFQSYALWPHMTVRKNIAYPLEARRMKDQLRDGAVERTAALVDCGHLLDRYPAQLSGGQQQRVALARGLVAQPDLMLFDEPLSNLDAQLRDRVRSELHALHRRAPFTAVFVTHDQSEALALAHRIAIMRAGKIEQFGTPQDVFEHPISEYVASFIGMSNRLVSVPGSAGRNIGVQPLLGAPMESHSNGDFSIRLRPEDIRLTGNEGDLSPNESAVKATVADSQYGGLYHDVYLRVDGVDSILHARTSAREAGRGISEATPGDSVLMAFNQANARFFAEASSSMGNAPARDVVEVG